MGTPINRHQLESDYFLTVQDISFASDAIGAASTAGGRAATAAWAENDTVVFKGKLKHILLFALMAFDVQSVAVLEKFELTPARKVQNVENLTPSDIVAVVDLDPAQGENIVLANDITFLEKLTNSFRLSWFDQKNIIVERKTDSVKTLYRGTVIQALAYAMQVHATLNAVVYTLFDFALLDVAAGVTKSVDYTALLGTAGPVELEPGHLTLADLILTAPVA